MPHVTKRRPLTQLGQTLQGTRRCRGCRCATEEEEEKDGAVRHRGYGVDADSCGAAPCAATLRMKLHSPLLQSGCAPLPQDARFIAGTSRPYPPAAMAQQGDGGLGTRAASNRTPMLHQAGSIPKVQITHGVHFLPASECLAKKYR
jgi:hypothetical protein